MRKNNRTKCNHLLRHVTIQGTVQYRSTFSSPQLIRLIKFFNQFLKAGFLTEEFLFFGQIQKNLHSNRILIKIYLMMDI